jgi:hypothetical protein
MLDNLVHQQYLMVLYGKEAYLLLVAIDLDHHAVKIKDFPPNTLSLCYNLTSCLFAMLVYLTKRNLAKHGVLINNDVYNVVSTLL